MTRNADERPLLVLTGSTGLIGTRIIDAMHDAYRIVGCDLNEPKETPDGWTWRQCDLADDRSVEQTLTTIRREFGSRIASVIHLAAHYDFSGEPSEKYETITVQGTRRLIKHLRSSGTVEQFIFSSSLLAMKPADSTDEVLTEESETRGEWDYPQSKLDAERVLKEEHGDIPVVVHRISGVYDEYGHSLPIAQHIRRIYEKKFESVLFPGDASRGQAFIHLDDLVDCFRKTVEKRRELTSWELFLVAEPDVMSHRELQESIGDLVHGKEWPTIRVPKVVAKAGAWAKDKLSREDAFIKPWMVDLADDHYPVEIARARARLDWEPRHRLRTTLPAMIEHLQRDPRKWYEINDLEFPQKMREREASGRA